MLRLLSLIQRSIRRRIIVYSHTTVVPVTLGKNHRQICDRSFSREGIIRLVGDDTVDGHRGKRVYGKARHRDAVRSSHSHTVFDTDTNGSYGHARGLAIHLAAMAFRSCRTVPRSKDEHRERRKHRTPAELMVGLLSLLLHWFPERTFVFCR